MPLDWQNQLAFVLDVETEYASMFASFRVVARMHLHDVDDLRQRWSLRRARIYCPMLRFAYLIECWKNAVAHPRPLYQPCRWCGLSNEKTQETNDRMSGEVCCGECYDIVCNEDILCYDVICDFLPPDLRYQWNEHARRLAFARANPYVHNPGTPRAIYGPHSMLTISHYV